MTIEENLKELINQEYQSILNFANESGIPYETIITILKRGINRATFSNISKICRALGISIEGLCNGRIVPRDWTSTDGSGYPRYVYTIFPNGDDGKPVGVYVGSAQNVDERIRNHINAGKNDRHGLKELHNLMRKNGYTVEVVDTMQSYDEAYKEYDWIDFFVRLSEMKVFNHRVGSHADFRRVIKIGSQTRFEERQDNN